jgi:hypothetical protein
MKLSYSLLAAAASALALAGAAHADMSGLVGNTIVIVMGDNTIKVQLHADGTYQTTMTSGPPAKGKWSEKDGQLCYNQTDPAPADGFPNPFCVDGMSGKKAGDAWSVTGPDGSAMKQSVVAGQ